jgi:hypothetical protein
VTYRLLLALVLAPDVWDLPSVVQRCYPSCITPLAMMLRRQSSGTACCNRWIVLVVDKITARIIAALSLALALTRSLQTLSYLDLTSIGTKR